MYRILNVNWRVILDCKLFLQEYPEYPEYIPRNVTILSTWAKDQDKEQIIIAFLSQLQVYFWKHQISYLFAFLAFNYLWNPVNQSLKARFSKILCVIFCWN